MRRNAKYVHRFVSIGGIRGLHRSALTSHAREHARERLGTGVHRRERPSRDVRAIFDLDSITFDGNLLSLEGTKSIV